MNNEDKKVTYKIGDKTVYIPESRQKDLLERYPDAKRMASFTLGDKIIHIPYERQKDFLDRYPDAKPLNTDGMEPSKKKVSTGVSFPQATSKDVSMASSNGSSQSGGRFVLDRQSILYPKTEPAVRESTQTPLSTITEEEKRSRYPEGAIYRRDLEKDIDIDKIIKEEKKHDFALDKKTLYPQIEPSIRESTKTQSPFILKPEKLEIKDFSLDKKTLYPQIEPAVRESTQTPLSAITEEYLKAIGKPEEVKLDVTLRPKIEPAVRDKTQTPLGAIPEEEKKKASIIEEELKKERFNKDLDEFNKLNLEAFLEIEKIKRNPDIIKNPEYLKYLKQLDDAITNKIEVLKSYKEEDVSDFTKRFPDDDISIWKSFYHAARRGLNNAKVAQILYDTDYNPTPEAIIELAKLNAEDRFKGSIAYQRFVNAQTTMGRVMAFLQDPVEILTQLTIESQVALLSFGWARIGTGMASGAMVGMPWAGAAIGMGSTSLGLERAGYIMEAFQEAGVDITNPDKLREAFENKELYDDIKKRALKKSVPVALFDFLSVLLAGRLFPKAPKGIRQKALYIGGELAMQAGFGAGGDALGQYLADKRVRWPDVVTEALSELGGAPSEIAGGVTFRKRGMVKGLNILKSENKEAAAAAHKQAIDMQVTAGSMTPEQANQEMEGIKKTLDAEERIPEGTNNREELAVLLAVRDELIEMKNNSDPAFHKEIDEKIDKIAKDIERLKSTAPEEREQGSKGVESKPESDVDSSEDIDKFVERIKRGEKLGSPEDIQFYENNKKEIEKRLRESSKEEIGQTEPTPAEATDVREGEVDLIMPDNLSDKQASDWVYKNYGIFISDEKAKKWVKENGYDPSIKERGGHKIGDKVKYRSTNKKEQVEGVIVGFSKDKYHTTFVKLENGDIKLLEGAFLDNERIESEQKAQAEDRIKDVTSDEFKNEFKKQFNIPSDYFKQLINKIQDEANGKNIIELGNRVKDKSMKAILGIQFERKLREDPNFEEERKFIKTDRQGTIDNLKWMAENGVHIPEDLAKEAGIKDNPKPLEQPSTQAEPTPSEPTKPTEEEQVKQQIKDFGVSDKEVEATHGLLDRVFTGLKKAGLTTAKKLSDWVSIGKGKETRSALKQIIGERGAEGIQTVKDNLTIAKQMEAEGKDPKTIFLATGWERDVQDKGQWKYDLPDVDFVEGVDNRIKAAEKSRTKEGIDLVQYVNDKGKLFKAYPQLRWVKVVFDKSAESHGKWNKLKGDGFGQITINPDMHKNDKEILSTLIHEIQHAIQDIEGFAKGGSEKMFSDKKVSKNKELIKQIREVASELFDSLPEEVKDFARAINRGENVDYNYKQLSKNKDAKRIWADYIEALKQIKELSNAPNDEVTVTAFEQYQRLAGEVEARNAQRRAEMTPEQRKTTMISESELLDDVRPEDKIYLYEEGVQQSIQYADQSDFNPDGTVKESVLKEIEKERAEIEAKAKADGTFGKAPNGKKSNLTDEQWITVRTRRFKSWFGDWENDPANASKVVDENGEPLVVYHGSPNKFDVFNLDRIGAQGTTEGHGFYFTSKKEVSEGYAEKRGKGQLLEVFLNIRNPYSNDKRTVSKAEIKNILRELHKIDPDALSNYGDVEYEGLNKVLNEAAEIENEAETDTDIIGSLINGGIADVETVLKVFTSVTGKDGVLTKWEGKEESTPIFVATSPNQIKSATSNIGTFSEGNPSILYQNTKEQENNSANAQFRIKNGQKIIEAIKDFDGSPEAVVALTHEIMHPTVVEIINGAKEGNEVGMKHTKTIVDEFNKANPDNKITIEQLIEDNDKFINGTTTDQYRAVQEFIAEAWERYHTEGAKGFSPEFQKVLEVIKEAFRAVYSAIKGEDISPELRKMFDEILGKETKESTAQVKLTELSEEERVKKQLETKESSQPSVVRVSSRFVEMPVKDINVDEKRFQNRTELDEEQLKNIIENWNENELDPVVLWKDEDGKTFLLAGHHRLEAAKQLGKEYIDARYFKGTEEEAIRYAKEKSNANRTMEQAFDRAKIYRKMREEGKSKKEIDKALEIEGKNKRFIERLSYLNPNGYAMQNLRSFSKAADRKTQKVIEGIAEWTGEVRKLNPELTNEHENEIYEYLYNNEKKSDKDPSKIKTMAEFVDLVNRRIHGLEEFNPDEPLNFEHKVGRGSNEALVVNEINKARADIKKIKKEIATAQRTITNKELRDREIRDLTKQVIELEQKIGDLEKKRIRAIEADKQQLDIFAQINEQIKNGNITTEQVRQFEQRTEDQITESEPTVKSIESKAESTSKAELNEAVREADKFIEDKTEDTGEDEARIETKPKKYAGKKQSPMEVSGGKPPQASEEMAKGSTKEVQEPSEQRGKERNEEIKEAAKRIADLIRKGKVSKPGGFSVQTPGSIVWDAAIEIAAQTIEAGGTMAQAVANGIKVIRESDWYKKLTEADKLRRESEFYDFVMNIPDDRDKNRRKRGFSKQFLNDTEIPDDIKNAISDEAIHYDRFPNKISLHTANAIYDELGAEKALLDMMNTSNGMPEAVRAMLGQVIIRRALEDGGAEYAVDLIKIAEEFLAKTATSFGQFNQALSLFQWLSPEGQVRYALRNEQIEINRRASKAKEDIDKKKKVLRNINKKVIDEVIGQHFSDTQLTQAVRKGLKDLGENIREIIRKHYTVYDNTKRTLTQKLIDEAGLTGEEAKYLADKVSEEFNRLATIEKQKALEKLRTIGQKLKQRKTKSLEDEIISLSNLGAFSDAEFLHIYAEKMGWKNIVDKDLENIRKLAERVQNEEEGFRRMRAVEDLLAYQANLGGIPFSELAQSVWYANILSGYKTHGINMLSNLSNLFLHYGVSVIRNPSDAAFLAKGMIYGFRRGIIEGKATWETGYSPISAKAEVPATLERRKFKSILYPLNAYKYVRRAMVAADVMFFEAAKEMRAYQFAKRIAVEQGKIDPSINQRQRALEIVGNTKEALAEATLQARQEYENRVAKIKADDKLSKSEKEALLKREKQDIKRRVFEILEKNRREVSPDIIPKSEDFGRRVTYNYTPEGLLGVGVAVVNEFTRKLPAAKYIIPFTNIIANVANEQINFSPLGFVRAARGGSITGNRKAPFDSDARNDMIVKAAIGTVSMAALYALSESDDDDGESLIDITANGFNDYRKNYNLKETGWQPYSIRIGNKWISYQYTPLMLSLSFIGALRDAQKYRKEKFDEKLMAKTRVAATQVVHSFFDATYVSSIDQLINLIANTNSKDVAEDVAQFFSKSATSFIVPNLYNQVASDIMSIMDIPAKDIDSRFYAQILRNVPVARDIFMNKVNGLGEEVLIDNDRFISYAKPSPLWELITRNKETITVESYNAFNGHGVYDPVKNIVRVVTPEEYYKYNRMRGAIIKHTLQEYYNKRLPESEMNALINSGSLKPGTKPMTLQELPQEAFSEFLKSLKRDATEDAKWYLFNEKEFIKDWGYVERE